MRVVVMVVVVMHIAHLTRAMEMGEEGGKGELDF